MYASHSRWRLSASECSSMYPAIASFNAWFGTNSKEGKGRPVAGALRRPLLKWATMFSLSYVIPSTVDTGSVMTCWLIGHLKHLGNGGRGAERSTGGASAADNDVNVPVSEKVENADEGTQDEVSIDAMPAGGRNMHWLVDGPSCPPADGEDDGAASRDNPMPRCQCSPGNHGALSPPWGGGAGGQSDMWAAPVARGSATADRQDLP